MFDISSLDRDKQKDGVWTDFSDGSFLIAYASKIEFQRHLARLQQPYIRKVLKGTLDPKVALEITCKALSTHILLDWKDVGAAGKLLPFSQAVAYKVLYANDELRDFVGDFSLELDNFRTEAIEEEGKPSASTTDGMSTTE